MKQVVRYILDPEDRICIFGEAEKTIEIDSGNRMMFFPLLSVQSAGIVQKFRLDRKTVSALCFAAEDALLGRIYEVLIPESNKNYVNFTSALQNALPNLAWLPPREDLPPACDQNGHHFA